MLTNINLLYDGNQYNYIIEYKRSNVISNGVKYIIDNVNQEVSFLNHDNNEDQCDCVIKKLNTWDKPTGDEIDSYIPNEYQMAEIVLYLPLYSLDLYDKIKYALTINTWINGYKVNIGAHILNRSQAQACDYTKTFMNNPYYECIKLEIIDPYSLMYSDNWKEFRERVCMEPVKTNSVGSIINFSLHPVTYNQDEEFYIKTDKYTGGQNSINMSANEDDFINLKLKVNTTDKLNLNARPAVVLDVGFNNEYNQTIGGLCEYLEETYKVKNCSIKYELVIGNEDDLYAVISKDLNLSDQEINTLPVDQQFTKDDILSTGNFINWSGWKEGIFLMGSINIMDEFNESVIYILSNKVPFTRNIYKYFVGTDFKIFNNEPINNVNLDLVNMRLYNINAVNKIENTVVQISRPEDVKSNLTQPMFYRSVEMGNINVHPKVIETICVNLDMYKSKVDTFILKIEDSSFVEIGRTQSGVLFKLKNPTILKDDKGKDKLSGVYYILNQDNELVTSGKYNYII